MNRVLFSSASVEWATPSGVYDSLNAEFAFTFDPCPLGGTQDGRAPLFCKWHGQRVFCNPPYNDIRRFLERWHEPDLVVYLIPARVDVRWFHELCLPHASEIRFIRGRLRFGDSVNTAPFPSMIVIFRNEDTHEVAAELASPQDSEETGPEVLAAVGNPDGLSKGLAS